MTSVLVTGCAGFIGSHLVDVLLDKGASVTGIDNFRTGKRNNLAKAFANPRFALLEMDICDHAFMEQVTGSFQTVFHLAAVSSVKLSLENPALVYRNNVEGALNVLELARAKDAKRVVLSSSAAVYGNPSRLPTDEKAPLNPQSPYAASKVAAEQYVIAYSNAYGIEPVILRYFNVYGPRQTCSEYSGVLSIFISQALNNQPITVDGDGKQTRNFIYVDDVARATQLASEASQAKGEIIKVSGSDAISILQLARTVMSTVGQTSSRIVHLPERKGDLRGSIGSMTKARRLLGFMPQVSLSEGLKRTVEWQQIESCSP
jgi:UDP-glucose 4-epimerase